MAAERGKALDAQTRDERAPARHVSPGGVTAALDLHALEEQYMAATARLLAERDELMKEATGWGGASVLGGRAAADSVSRGGANSPPAFSHDLEALDAGAVGCGGCGGTGRRSRRNWRAVADSGLDETVVPASPLLLSDENVIRERMLPLALPRPTRVVPVTRYTPPFGAPGGLLTPIPRLEQRHRFRGEIEAPPRGDPRSIVCPSGASLDCFLPTDDDVDCVLRAVRAANALTAPYFDPAGLGAVGGWNSSNYVALYNNLWIGFFESELDAPDACPGLFPPHLRVGLAQSVGLSTSVDLPAPYSLSECLAMRIAPPCGYSTHRGYVYGQGFLHLLDRIEYCRCL